MGQTMANSFQSAAKKYLRNMLDRLIQQKSLAVTNTAGIDVVSIILDQRRPAPLRDQSHMVTRSTT